MCVGVLEAGKTASLRKGAKGRCWLCIPNDNGREDDDCTGSCFDDLPHVLQWSFFFFKKLSFVQSFPCEVERRDGLCALIRSRGSYVTFTYTWKEVDLLCSPAL